MGGFKRLEKRDSRNFLEFSKCKALYTGRNNLHSGHRLESNELEGSSTGKDLVDNPLSTSEQ